MAQSWTVSNNSSTITFTIRPGLTFSTGATRHLYRCGGQPQPHQDEPLRSSLSAISSIETPNPSTVVVNLSKPTAGDFLWASTYVDGQIYPARRHRHAIHPAGGRGPVRTQELQARVVHRSRQEPEVLGLEGVPPRWGGLHTGDAGSRGSDGPHVGCGRHDRGRARELPDS